MLVIVPRSSRIEGIMISWKSLLHLTEHKGVWKQTKYRCLTSAKDQTLMDMALYFHQIFVNALPSIFVWLKRSICQQHGPVFSVVVKEELFLYKDLEAAVTDTFLVHLHSALASMSQITECLVGKSICSSGDFHSSAATFDFMIWAFAVR